MLKQLFSGVLQNQFPEKIRKFHKKIPVLDSFFNKVFRYEETPTQVFSCKFCEAFTNTFLSLKKFYIVGVHKKVFVWLAANEFLSNSKNYLLFSCISISFSPFSRKPAFSTNEVFEHLSMKKDPFNQIIRKWLPKGVFVDLLDKYSGMNADL